MEALQAAASALFRRFNEAGGLPSSAAQVFHLTSFLYCSSVVALLACCTCSVLSFAALAPLWTQTEKHSFLNSVEYVTLWEARAVYAMMLCSCSCSLQRALLRRCRQTERQSALGQGCPQWPGEARRQLPACWRPPGTAHSRRAPATKQKLLQHSCTGICFLFKPPDLEPLTDHRPCHHTQVGPNLLCCNQAIFKSYQCLICMSCKSEEGVHRETGPGGCACNPKP